MEFNQLIEILIDLMKLSFKTNDFTEVDNFIMNEVFYLNFFYYATNENFLLLYYYLRLKKLCTIMVKENL